MHITGPRAGLLLLAALVAVSPALPEAGSEGSREDAEASNEISLFVGSTQAGELPEDGGREDPRFGLGVDYERRLIPWLGIGGILHWVLEGDREFLVAAPVFFHVGKHAKLTAAPGVQRQSSGEHDLVARLGFLWAFRPPRVSLAPTVNIDFTESTYYFVYGLNIGWDF